MKRLRTAAVAPNRCWASTPATPREARWKTAMQYAVTPRPHTSQARREAVTAGTVGAGGGGARARGAGASGGRRARPGLRPEGRHALALRDVHEGVPVHRLEGLGTLGDDGDGHSCTVPREPRTCHRPHGRSVILLTADLTARLPAPR